MHTHCTYIRTIHTQNHTYMHMPKRIIHAKWTIEGLRDCQIIGDLAQTWWTGGGLGGCGLFAAFSDLDSSVELRMIYDMNMI